jgi:hypothetical protein
VPPVVPPEVPPLVPPVDPPVVPPVPPCVAGGELGGWGVLPGADGESEGLDALELGEAVVDLDGDALAEVDVVPEADGAEGMPKSGRLGVELG